jgi:ABC-type multidrug transport system fused ATPase/permease subunit
VSLSSSETLPTWPIFLVFVILLPITSLVLFCREEAELILIRERQNSEDRWVHAINDMVASRHIIIAYDCVEKIGAEFKTMYDDFYTKHRASRFYQQTSQWIPSWLLASILFLAYAFAPALVETFNISAGDFASIIKSWLKLKSGVEAFYKCLLKLQRSIVGLEKIADILNRQTSYEERLNFKQKQDALDLAQHTALLVS